MRIISDIPLANNFEQKSVNFKKNRKPPVGPISASKSRSAVRKGKNNRNTAKKKSGLSSKVEIRKPSETVSYEYLSNNRLERLLNVCYP